MNKRYDGIELKSEERDGSNDYFNYYKIKSGDTLYDLSKKYEIDLDLLSKINGIYKNSYIYPNQTLMIPKENVKVYITKKEDTLDKVSKKLNISIEDMINDNNIYLLEDQLIIYK